MAGARGEKDVGDLPGCWLTPWLDPHPMGVLTPGVDSLLLLLEIVARGPTMAGPLSCHWAGRGRLGLPF